MSSVDQKYEELYKLLLTHEWEEFKLKLSQYFDVVDVNVRDKKNNYLLTYAVLLNRLDIINSLVESGGNIDIVDVDGRSILYYVINLQYNDILDRLLEINERSVGVSIVHIKDKYGKIPIHYAIGFKNKYALTKLIEYNSSLGAKDNEGNNALHQAIYSRDNDIIEVVSKYIQDINARCSTGENSLHIAANIQNYQICELLINNKVDVNAVDYEHEFSALHYVVTLGNVKITALLMKNKADPNIQDIYGNTPLHYGIMENSYACVMEIISKNYMHHVINYNLWNIDQKIPIHLFFNNYETNKLYYINMFIYSSSMALQDNYGNSCLHYLCINNLWSKYISILEYAKLDIFSKNSQGKSPIDYVDANDIDKFLKIVATSYLNRLKKKKNKWIDSIDTLCSREFTQLTSSEKSKLSNVKNAYDLENTCTDMIEKKIRNTLAQIKKGNLHVSDKSYPVKNTAQDIRPVIGIPVNFCTYTGSTLDVLIGLVYLLQTHNNVCSTLSKNYADNNELFKFYKSLGLVMSNRSEFLNFEIVWVHLKLYIMGNFYDVLKKCVSSHKRFIVIPVGIELANGSHANYMIYDRELHEIERFEPHGSTTPPGLNYNPDLLDDILEKRFKLVDDKLKYIRPHLYLPKIGFQLIDATESSHKKIGDPGGFCALWSLWYTDMRLTYPQIERKKLVKKLMTNMISDNISFRNMIRNYSNHITSIRDTILKKADMDINNWLNDDYTQEQLDVFMAELDKTVYTIAK